MMEAVLSNADHPEYGVATIPLPIPRNQYDHCVALLEALEIGDASEADCRLDSLDSAWPVLNRLVCTKVNLDELDYLAKRLDSFTVGEFSQFQAMAEKLNLASMKDLINLTFCCQQATVITDFTNLREIGRDHYMNIHGGCASMEELEQLDGEETAILLIEDNEGTVTRYGVVYDNGMQLSQLYDGKHLPCYHYEADMTAVGITSRQEPENSKNVTWVYLPASKGQIERAMQRSGITDPKDMCLWICRLTFISRKNRSSEPPPLIWRSFSAAGAKSSLPPAERNGWPVTIASPSAATSGTIMPRSGAATPSASCSGFITSAIRRR